MTLARWLALTVAPCFIAAVAAQPQSPVFGVPSPYAPPILSMPLTPASIESSLRAIAQTARLAVGFEGLPEEPQQPALSSAPPWNLAGLTVTQVLNGIVQREPRYGWSVDSGIIHLHPTSAITDPADVLNRPIEAFQFEGLTLNRAITEINFALHPDRRGGGIGGSGPPPSPLGQRPFNVNVQHTTLLGVLDAIITAHGASSWSVTHTDDGWTRISLNAFDGWGIANTF